MIQADLHVHTAFSGDSSNQPKALVEQLNAHPSIKVMAVTDHNTLKGYFKVHELATTYPDILIVPGTEISTHQGEIIILGVTELPPEPWNPENVVSFARKNGGLLIAPHPYRGLGLHDNALKIDLDAIEVLNGITPPSLNKKAEELAKQRNLPGVAGSDAHDKPDMWSVYTEIQASLDADEILAAIKGGNVKVASTSKSIHF